MSGPSGLQRGQVWLADLDPTFGHEQGGRRPVVLVSVDAFNTGQSGLAIVLPVTSRIRPLPLHVPVSPPEGGLRVPSAILCDALRSIDQRRLIACWGTLTATTLATVEEGYDRKSWIVG
jgi:mRNA interferase MazF